MVASKVVMVVVVFLSEAFELRNVDFGYNLDEGYFIFKKPTVV
jgi:hypothetical protein